MDYIDMFMHAYRLINGSKNANVGKRANIN